MGNSSDGRIDQVIDRLNRERAAEAGKMQCKVCWWVYDPEKGVDEADIEPGVPFNELPDFFTCPVCGNGKESFLPFIDPETSP